jgi:tetratricopeptide (TPR) repeat protein
MQSSTIPALRKQVELRIERGNAALVNGEVAAAAAHLERSSRYFSGIDPPLEAENRHECATLLRYYGYRYKNAEALLEAKIALRKNLNIWSEDEHIEQWCRTKNALGTTSWRLSQFDVSEHSMQHLANAKEHYEDVRTRCSEEILPKEFAAAGLDLANIYSNRTTATSVDDYASNLQKALSLLLSALRVFSKAKDPRAWGIVQHNLGCTYIALAKVRPEKAKSISDIGSAIRHAEFSFEVRNPEDSLQYWLASCRTLGEALLNLSNHSGVENPDQYARRAEEVLLGAVGRISASEHPHQWAEIDEQLARCRERAASTNT